MMKILKTLVTAASLLTLSGAAQAIEIDFVALADGSLGESAWSPLMFDAGGDHTTVAGDAFLTITATNGGDSYPYLDAGHGGLGACGDASDVNVANPGSKGNLCSPGSDDNISDHGGTPETVHFVFADDVIVDSVVLNNNHDGDRSLLNDFVIAGLEGSPAVQITGAANADGDHTLPLDLALTAGTHFDVGFYPTRSCYDEERPDNVYADCELYISSITYSDDDKPPSEIPEPTTLALLSLGLIGMGAVRRRQR